ncbi:hypothetical protein Trydic_g914 [Trypoxylus dichotomus]
MFRERHDLPHRTSRWVSLKFEVDDDCEVARTSNIFSFGEARAKSHPNKSTIYTRYHLQISSNEDFDTKSYIDEAKMESVVVQTGTFSNPTVVHVRTKSVPGTASTIAATAWVYTVALFDKFGFARNRNADADGSPNRRDTRMA